MSTTTKNLGRVSIVPKGEWSNNSTYTRLDLVTYNGSSYIARKNVPINIELNNNEYWMPIANKGDMGDPLVFIAIYGETTYDEIESALNNGKMIVAYNNGIFGGHYCELSNNLFDDQDLNDNQQYQFTRFNIDQDNKKYLYVMECIKDINGNTSWSNNRYNVEIAEEEFKEYVNTTITNLNLQNLSQLEYEVIT